MKNIVLFIILILLINSCKHTTIPTVEELVKANTHLNIVLKKYESDSLKILAAKFLIENLPYYYSLEGQSINNYLKLYELHGTGLYYPNEVLDSINKLYGKFSFDQTYVHSDLDINPDYLIDNIDWAFKVWKEQPWGKNVSFDDFCEYILPYRVGDEIIKPWREKIYNKFNPILDSIRNLPEAEDPIIVAQIILDSLNKKPFYFTELFSFGPHVGPDVVEWRSGNCREGADLPIYVFRALGIPCGCDFMLLRGDSNVPHFWDFVLDKNGEAYYCSAMYGEGKLMPLRNYWSIKAKVYRRNFGRDNKAIKKMEKSPKNIHPTFRYTNLKDVTRLYSGKFAQKLEIPRENLYHELNEKEIVYLCGSSWMHWIPLAWTLSGKSDICFDNIEGGVTLRLAIYKDEKLSYISDPFVLEKESRDIHFFTKSTEMEEVILINKYHQFIEPFAHHMIGGVFEGSNNSDFKNCDTLHIIKEFPLRLYNKVTVSNKKKYRYLRYIGPPNSFCDISEVSFFKDEKDTIPLQGEIIGTPNGDKGDGKHEFTNVYDGDPYTSFTYYLPSGGWAGLDLINPESISKITFTPRNRDNYIRIGDRYELFYSDHDQWISTGMQVPDSDSLLYVVPKGVLLYLKNHTRGTNERIFEYTNGKQIYW